MFARRAAHASLKRHSPPHVADAPVPVLCAASHGTRSRGGEHSSDHNTQTISKDHWMKMKLLAARARRLGLSLVVLSAWPGRQSVARWTEPGSMALAKDKQCAQPERGCRHAVREGRKALSTALTRVRVTTRCRYRHRYRYRYRYRYRWSVGVLTRLRS